MEIEKQLLPPHCVWSLHRYAQSDATTYALRLVCSHPANVHLMVDRFAACAEWLTTLYEEGNSRTTANAERKSINRIFQKRMSSTPNKPWKMSTALSSRGRMSNDRSVWSVECTIRSARCLPIRIRDHPNVFGESIIRDCLGFTTVLWSSWSYLQTNNTFSASLQLAVSFQKYPAPGTCFVNWSHLIHLGCGVSNNRSHDCLGASSSVGFTWLVEIIMPWHLG